MKSGISLGLITCFHLLLGNSVIAEQAYAFRFLVGSPHNHYPDGTNQTASIDRAYGVETRGTNVVIVADTDGYTIRKLTRIGTDWVLTTLAGSMLQQGSQDGTNDSARFSYPMATASDAAGNIYVADAWNNRVRKMSLEGTNWVVRTFPTPAYSNTFFHPYGIAVDQFTNVYVSEYEGNRIQMIAAQDTNWIVKVIAGSGWTGSADGTNTAARFYKPAGISFDRFGNLYVADTYNSVIRKMTPLGADWVVTTIAGLAFATGNADGTNSDARFNGPVAVTVDSSGTVFVSDYLNYAIRAMRQVGTNWIVTTVRGNGGSPTGISVDPAGNLFIADITFGNINCGQPVYGLKSTVSGDRLIVSWPVSASNDVLETSVTLSTTSSWMPFTGSVGVADTEFTITNDLSAPSCFYRLRRR